MSNIATLSKADEIGKFKKLLDAGIITQEEFDYKKKVLLGM
jgi:predicted Zn-dependent peptidase